jgi:membrane-associated protein
MIDAIVGFFEWLLEGLRNPGMYIQWGGYPALFAIIYLETGALVFFLPGDSLLVVAGLYAAKGDLNIWLLNLLLIPAAIIGDATSYMIGKRLGPRLFNRPKSRLFNPKHIQRAHEFYERHGGKAIIIARFVPIVRTFVPVVAGAAQMRYRDFATYNIVGGVAWIVSMTLTGYFLGNVVPGIDKHIEKLIILVVFLSLTPAMYEWAKAKLRARAAARAAKAAAPAESEGPAES